MCNLLCRIDAGVDAGKADKANSTPLYKIGARSKSTIVETDWGSE
jgi:hypothetical protein